MKQIDKLANFIMAEVEGEPSISEGAGDTAIRIIKKLQKQSISKDDIAGAVARGWCHKANEKKTMDTDLAFAIVDEIIKILPMKI